jgi:hypothetical protein
MAWSVYSSTYLFWLVYGSALDVPAVLRGLVRLGYEVARSGFREGRVYVDALPGGYAGRRVYEEGEVYLLVDLPRGALGVTADKHQLAMRGAADLSRVLSELSVPEPPRAEFNVSLGVVMSACGEERVEMAGVVFDRRGHVLVSGEPQGGNGIYLSVNPLGGDRYLVFASISGKWGYVIEHAKRVNEIVWALLARISCSASARGVPLTTHGTPLHDAITPSGARSQRGSPPE